MVVGLGVVGLWASEAGRACAAVHISTAHGWGLWGRAPTQ